MNLYIGNSNAVRINGLRSSVTGNYVNNATCSFTVLRNGVAITGGSNIAMAYVSGSNGDYVGVLPETADLNNSIHVVVITADAGTNMDALWRISLRPTVRNK